MLDQHFQEQVVGFFDAFVEAFKTFDGGHIAERYAAPYTSLQADGTLQLFQTADAIAQYFQRTLDNYYAQGCRTCCYRDLESIDIGGNGVLSSVTWELLREDGQVFSRWRESYGLVRNNGQLRVFTSIDHTG